MRGAGPVLSVPGPAMGWGEVLRGVGVNGRHPDPPAGGANHHPKTSEYVAKLEAKVRAQAAELQQQVTLNPNPKP